MVPEGSQSPLLGSSRVVHFFLWSPLTLLWRPWRSLVVEMDSKSLKIEPGISQKCIFWTRGASQTGPCCLSLTTFPVFFSSSFSLAATLSPLFFFSLSLSVSVFFLLSSLFSSPFVFRLSLSPPLCPRLCLGLLLRLGLGLGLGQAQWHCCPQGLLDMCTYIYHFYVHVQISWWQHVMNDFGWVLFVCLLLVVSFIHCSLARNQRRYFVSKTLYWTLVSRCVHCAPSLHTLCHQPSYCIPQHLWHCMAR